MMYRDELLPEKKIIVIVIIMMFLDYIRKIKSATSRQNFEIYEIFICCIYFVEKI